MDWKLFDAKGEFLMEVNCQYDSLDLATMMYDAKVIECDFAKQEAHIKEYN